MNEEGLKRIKLLLYWGSQAVALLTMIVLFAYYEATTSGIPPVEYMAGFALTGILVFVVAGSFVRVGP